MKRRLIISMSVLGVVAVVSVTLLIRNRPSEFADSDSFKPGGKTYLVMNFEFPERNEFMIIDPDTFVKADSGISPTSHHIYSVLLTPMLLESNGSSTIFTFEITDNGVRHTIDRFVYSGEESVTVMRGINWTLQVRKLY